ncbi:hypothetical protein H1164_17135 [Thermoactinomyces daqus]|uniref:Uncharacterized protein n=1 Tax=Thermoactinomyces daqus TaxID=1329516 RepID=A0A7W1XDD8_9BACL|nr:hypothetical protein [Thermoactinomyces daqus]MBA4544556.1 hypothetical protein [Thermoactinomyces daqus]
MLNFLDDLLRGGDSDRIAENPWGSGQGPSLDLPQGDEKDPLKDCGWLNVKSDF